MTGAASSGRMIAVYHRPCSAMMSALALLRASISAAIALAARSPDEAAPPGKLAQPRKRGPPPCADDDRDQSEKSENVHAQSPLAKRRTTTRTTSAAMTTAPAVR